MNKENTEKLINRFPFYRPGDTPADYLYYGFECGDGWFNLIWELSEELEKAGFIGEDFRVTQVKEKFGGLRYYTNYTTDVMDEIIEKYEEKSYRVCERCGAEGKVRGDSWVYTACDKCYEEIKNGQ